MVDNDSVVYAENWCCRHSIFREGVTDYSVYLTVPDPFPEDKKRRFTNEFKDSIVRHQRIPRADNFCLSSREESR